MKNIKKIVALMLVLTILVMGMPSVLAEEGASANNNARMYSFAILLTGNVMDGYVYTTCEVDGPSANTSIDIFCILRKMNASGNFVIVDTWRDSSTSYYLFNEHEYSPAADGEIYELSVRVGIYNENGLVGYDYETLTDID